MHCDAVREILEEASPAGLSDPVREHLTRCADCAAYAREWRLVHAGFQVLKDETAPEPTLGFAARLVRKLDEAHMPSPAEAFLERVGRRVVYATLLMTFVLLLALALPPSGPLRGPSVSELLSAGPEVTVAVSDPVFPYELPNELELVPNASTGTRVNREQ